MSEATSERTKVRRGATRAAYDRASLLAVLDAGMVAHVGVSTDEGPVVLPMAYARTDDRLYLHGATGNALLAAAVGRDICVTVTIVDGLVVARTPFHHSMNYRSVVVRGVAAEVDDDEERRTALRLISDHVTPTWEYGRPPTEPELRRTRVLAVPLVELSGKIRSGGPTDRPEDRDAPYWGGSVPLERTWGSAVPDDGLSADVAVPPGVAAIEGRPLP